MSNLRNKTRVSEASAPAASRPRWPRWFVCLILFGIALGAAAYSLLPWWHLQTGLAHLDARRPEDALESFSRARRWSGESGALAFWQARAYRKLGQMNEVRRCLARARALGYDRALLRREEVLAQAQSGQLQKSLPRLPRLLVDAADDADEICEAFAEGLVMHHRFSEALTLLDAWQKDFPQDPRPHAYRAAISVSGANWLDARRHWMQARDCAPEESEYLLGLAEASFELNDLEATIDALEVYERLTPRRQREPRADLLRAKTLLQRGDAPAARQILTKLEQQPETAVSATLLLCRIGLEAGETTGLKEKLQSIVQSEPWNTDARHLLARTCTVTGDLASAEEQQSALLTLTRNQQDLQNLLEEVRKSPRDASRRYRVAQLAVRCGPPEDAIPWLLSVLDLDPHHSDSHRLLASLYRETGLPQLAQSHEQLASRPPNAPQRDQPLQHQ